MKLPAVHFGIIRSEMEKGIEGANFGKIMSASAALKRFKEENRGVSIEASVTDCLVKVKGNPQYAHKGDFFGKILSCKENQIIVKDLGKRAFNKAVSEIGTENISLSSIPSEAILMEAR